MNTNAVLIGSLLAVAMVCILAAVLLIAVVLYRKGEYTMFKFKYTSIVVSRYIFKGIKCTIFIIEL